MATDGFQKLRKIGAWTIFLDEDEYLVPAGHPSIQAGRRWATEGVVVGNTLEAMNTRVLFDVDGLPDGLSAEEALERYAPEGKDALLIPTFWCEDEAGLKPLSYIADVRALCTRRYDGAELPAIGARGFAIDGATNVGYCGYASIVKFPNALRALASGDYRTALDLAKPYENLAFFQRVTLKAREAQNTAEALVAFERLYVHYSLNEELWRLGQVFKNLPYDLEEHPRVLELHAQYRRQIGHLDDVRRWYAEGSPGEVINDWYVENAKRVPSTRLKWVAGECARLGYARVVELGALDGSSLFPLMAMVPEITWHGVEVSRVAVAHGKMLAAKHGVLDLNLHHVKSFKSFATQVMEAESGRYTVGTARSNLYRFDAALLLEVLEHNPPEEGRAILNDAVACVQPGGRVFISTPCGNWSAFDRKTQDLELPKDHILSFTPKRMRELLESLPYAKDIEVERVENPAYSDNNAWVFASFACN